MAWVRNPNGRCVFYRSRRVGDRFARDYLGDGAAAEAAAAAISLRRLLREAEARSIREDKERWNPVESSLERLSVSANLLYQATLVAAGFHLHARTKWRKRRVWSPEHNCR